MSRPQGHRKSQSTSALSFLASQSQSHPSSHAPLPSAPRAQRDSDREGKSRARSRASHLPSVDETASISVLPGLSTPGSEGMRRSKSTQSHGMTKDKSASEGADEWLNDIRSLRSSSRRRLAALKGLERTLVEGCMEGRSDRPVALQDLISRQLHQPLLSLLVRHTSALSSRSASTSIPPNDEMAVSLIPELSVVVSILQGLCLLSNGCKDAVGDSWVMEMFIDILLLLRAQPAIGDDQRPIAYALMELLFCVLVDSPRNARSFEKLSGLEAVVRVLKGTGVTKDVRMKCIEFLYFYLLPEQNDTKRAVSSSSSSSSSSTSTDSQLYPPSPLSSPGSSLDSASNVIISHHGDGRMSPANQRKDHLSDVDMPFVPMTPRKPPQPNLGYLTPATRKSSVCTSTSSTPGLATVPASPRLPSSSTSKGLAAMLDEVEGPSAQTPRSSRLGKSLGDDFNQSQNGVGLGLGLPKSTSGLVRSSTVQRDLSSTSTARSSTHSSTFTDPFNLTASSERSHSGSSGSSTVVPGSRSLSRSSTYSSLNANGLPRPPGTVSSGGSMRRLSVRRVSKSPLVQSTVPEASSPGLVTPPVPRTPKIRHSRTQSHLTALSGHLPPPPVPSLQAISTPSTSTSTDKVAQARTPSKPRAFPAELTRGLPPSASSPSLSSGLTPLGASKRIPSASDRRPPPSAKKEDKGKGKADAKAEGGKKKEVKSVEEKKAMLGMWLGNVDQLVQGVEKVSFWGSIGNGASRSGRV